LREERLADVDAGGVDQDVGRPEEGAALLRAGLELASIGEVGADHLGPLAAIADLVPCGGELGLAPCHQDDRSPGLREGTGDLAADPGARPGDHRDVPGEVEERAHFP
jgi:hypothetical protein